MSYDFLIIGFGSIGIRHANNIKKLFPKNKVYLISNTPKNFDEERLIYKRINFKDLKLINKKFITFICNTPNLHLLTAKKLLNFSHALFIEKPLSNEIKGIDQFLSIIHKRKIVCNLGYQFRYHPLVNKLKENLLSKLYGQILSVQIHCSSYLPHWRKGRDYKKDISSKKKLGGGVLLELSHEIDLAYYLFGNFNAVYASISNTKTLNIETEDTVEIILNQNLFNCNIHLDFHSYNKERFIVINFSKASIKLDLLNNQMNLYQNNKVKKTRCNKDTYDNIYLLEIKDLLKNLRKKNYENKILKDSAYVMKIISACKKSSNYNKRVKV